MFQRLVTLTFLCAVFLVTDAFAQTRAFDIGLKGGVNLATFRTDVEDFDSRTGLNAGLFTRLSAGPIAIQPELLYAQKGAAFSFQIPEFDGFASLEGVGADQFFPGSSIDVTYKVDYLEIPVLAVLEIPSGPLSPFLMAGPALGVKLNESVSVDGFDDDFIEDGDDEVNSIDFGLVLGGGLDFALPSGQTVVLDARYTLGLTDIFDTPEFDDDFNGGVDENAQNGVFSFSIGLLF